MKRYTVNDMTCEHCAGTITKAVEATNPDATVTVDLDSKVVSIDTTASDNDMLSAIRSAGYEPQPAA